MKRALLRKADSKDVSSLLLTPYSRPYYNAVLTFASAFHTPQPPSFPTQPGHGFGGLPYPRVGTLRTSPKTLKLANSASLGIDHVWPIHPSCCPFLVLDNTSRLHMAVYVNVHRLLLTSLSMHCFAHLSRACL
ncbi:hypothetical protein FVEG_15117 [Fusarium verticillioides 7600]|uniref:Uncharacterized protein n=1 Tax=Gibberella moniliformis (strain M3125 / FGSC 7600) TaxID=334819 RepID=W7LNX4_GIBM7|nr:hypothetical protein FVEG_15117 [Fusarium verticillioides 7600]XP_018746386.1 hypothetical protein FVEG_15117 [Fusarium verticillioides 7600]XP_018746387.1 hypothetical protein FVEG_15117 [Fusarium verticillioides 7600]XP_018746388.1 hypothetical protein FVEG_15117 [Fusarium verticillioides 7600]XP_018746389.1 hypothetical protein FVEG_15117 [Fusarium verticillioides 7600]XP_018746390.1 hypothetical protein FVEG_15117 [Fusarium verticillioides 7600]XP_018746391.1 hypothetical protein FVEG_